MKQYIDKAKVIVEIERRKQKLLDHIIFEHDKDWVVRTVHQLNRIILFINTLEVKEVDLDKEARHYLLNEHKSPLSAVFHQTDLHSEIQYHEDIENAFKAGFELGIKTKGGKE